MKRVVAFVVLALTLCILGLGVITSSTLNVVWFRRRPFVLKFGSAEKLGHCLVRETADPTSDVLSNLIDLDSDGRPEWRSAGFIDGSPPQCERRAFLGFWVSEPVASCRAAAESCAP